MKLFTAKQILEDIGETAVAIKMLTKNDTCYNDLSELILKLQNSLSDLNWQIGDFREENIHLKEKVLQLKGKLQEREGPPRVFEEAYQFKSDDKDNFYCTKCFDTEGLKILLKPDYSLKGYEPVPRVYDEVVVRCCPVCKTSHYADYYYRVLKDLSRM